MPHRSGSKRVAARQTQLGQRKKRQPRGAPTVSPARDTLGVPTATDTRVAPPAQEYRPEAPRAARPGPSSRVEPPPALQGYVKAEMRRIFALTAAVVVILVVLTFVLR
jgi:hypothetical protein